MPEVRYPTEMVGGARAGWRPLRARHPGHRAVTLFTLVAVAYVIGAELSWHSFGSGLAFGFPPAGVDVAVLLLTPRRLWPAVVAAIVVAEAAVDLQHHLMIAVALGSAAANAVEPLVGASCVLWFCRGRRPDLGTRGDLARFVVGAAVLGPLAGALIGASVNWLSTDGWWPGLALQWWAGDGIAVLVIGGPVLLWSQRRAMVSARWAELTLVLLAAVALSVVAFRFGEAPFLLFLPILAWAAFRLGDLGVVLAGTAFAAVANYMTAAGYGSLAHLGLSSPGTVAVTQAYIAIVVLIGWVLAQEVAGRMSAVHDRDSAQVQREVAETRQMTAELGVVLADAASARSVGEQVSAAVRTHVAAAHVVISVLAPGGKRFEQLAGAGAEPPPAAMTTERMTGRDGPGPQAVRDRAAVYLRSAAALPLLTEVGALGYLGVWWQEPHESTAAEREYLRGMAEMASRALERARLRQAERRERGRVETLAELTGLLAAALTPQAIGEVAADRVRGAVGDADALCLGLVSQDGTQLEWITATGYGEEIRERFCDLPLTAPASAAEAVRTGLPVIIRTSGEYERRYPGPDAAAVTAQASSWLAWPLRVGTTPVGAIGLMWRNPQQFEPGRLAFVAAVADLMAQALVRARVYADEHAIAVLLQRAVMPTMAAAIPGLDIGACYRQAGTAGQIGGDWYDALALPAGRAYLAVGDVVGHGLTAAQDMTQLRNAGRAMAIAGHQPADILRELARITDWATSGKYATMAAVTAEPDAAVLTYASAGHPPIMIRRARTDAIEILPPAGGPALCVVRDDAYPRYTQDRVGFEAGDIMLMYTDGLIERRGEDLSEGIARVAEHLQYWRSGMPLGYLCDRLVDSLAAEPQLDDVCVLAVSRPQRLAEAGMPARSLDDLGVPALSFGCG